MSEVSRLGQVYDKMILGGLMRPGASALTDAADLEEVGTIVEPSGKNREEDYDKGKERDTEDIKKRTPTTETTISTRMKIFTMATFLMMKTTMIFWTTLMMAATLCLNVK